MAARNMEDIASVIKHMHFKKRLFGGVDEADVWRQIEKLQKEYRAAYDAQQERSNALLRERDDEIARLRGYAPRPGMERQGGMYGQKPS